jgi:hypothetical protein
LVADRHLDKPHRALKIKGWRIVLEELIDGKRR